jgi:hypothetical protein
VDDGEVAGPDIDLSHSLTSWDIDWDHYQAFASGGASFRTQNGVYQNYPSRRARRR